ncbi:MAG TPA: ferrous iron transporter B [Stellaceae bacterium]|nr:ferrous iron transporter B [Stellaceae bacterium]
MSELTLPARVALVGNPNSGKTALFNALTGSRQKVANYPGVTVDRKEGLAVTPAGLTVRLIDLPGTYSLRARSLDEVVTRDIVLGRLDGEDVPGLLVCVADSTNLRVALRLALELSRVGRPMILALNMFDIARHRGLEIDLERLSTELGIPVVASIAVRRGGTRDLLARIDEVIHEHGWPQALAPRAVSWSEPNAAQLRAMQREADRILDTAVGTPGRPDSFTRRLDRILLHPVLGLVILLAILFLMFQAVFTWAQAPMDLIKSGFDGLAAWAAAVLPSGWVLSFVRDGMISGVGSVIVFLPQILTLFFFILLLEDFGYMARAAFLMDRIMGGVGLHGRAFIPLLSSFACAIPGIMATRVISSRRGRLATILVAPLMTCSARIPVYTLVIAAFIPARTVFGWLSLQGLVMFGLYTAGIASALGMSWVFNRFLWRREPSEPFMLELPDYKRPVLRNIALGLVQRGQIFLKRAGTTIFAMMVVIWFLCSVPPAPPDAAEPAINYSLAARIGQAMEPVLRPVGFNWQIDVALVPGMAAREVAVAALGTVYSIAGADENPGELGRVLTAHWSLGTALALLAWYVFAPQCASTLSVVRRETNSWKWTAFLFSYMLALAYLAAFVTYQAAAALGAG